ncbi:hypothetical protein LguiA_020005 [Lonicera macranthoides]
MALLLVHWRFTALDIVFNLAGNGGGVVVVARLAMFPEITMVGQIVVVAAAVGQQKWCNSDNGGGVGGEMFATGHPSKLKIVFYLYIYIYKRYTDTSGIQSVKEVGRGGDGYIVQTWDLRSSLLDKILDSLR